MRAGERSNTLEQAFAVYLSLGTLAFLVIAGRPRLDIVVKALPFLPAVLLAAALNAFNEEMTYKASFLAVLEEVVGERQALWLMAAYFGILHFSGAATGSSVCSWRPSSAGSWENRCWRQAACSGPGFCTFCRTCSFLPSWRLARSHRAGKKPLLIPSLRPAAHAAGGADLGRIAETPQIHADRTGWTQIVKNVYENLALVVTASAVAGPILGRSINHQDPHIGDGDVPLPAQKAAPLQCMPLGGGWRRSRRVRAGMLAQHRLHLRRCPGPAGWWHALPARTARRSPTPARRPHAPPARSPWACSTSPRLLTYDGHPGGPARSGFVDRSQRPLERRTRPGQVAGLPSTSPRLLTKIGHLGMIRPEGGFVDASARSNAARAPQVALVSQHLPQVVDQRGHVG